ncbi:hypothetical protein KEJ27_09350 [Candidatus Bathyarchaeota archaeon]|nr:hypothetical protein [Candidatus Bathyarchaeota archaeon]
MSVLITIQLNTGICGNFTDDNGGRKRRSITLAPVKVRVEQCHNRECFYAKVKTSGNL